MNDDADLQTAYVFADGIRWRYLHVGVRDASSILLLHGFMTTSYSWRGVWPLLARDCRVIVPDLPGSGGSECAHGPHSVASMSRALRGFIDAIGIDRLVIVGAQMGGSIAAWFASQYRERVSGLVLVAAGGLGERPTNLLLYRLVATPVVGDVLVRAMPSRMFYRKFRQHLVNVQAVPELALRQYWRAFKRSGRQQASVGCGVRRSFEEHAGEYEAAVATINIPTLLIWGRDDPIVPVETGERFARRIANARLVTLPRCGAFPHEEYPLETSELVRQFLRERVATPGA